MKDVFVFKRLEKKYKITEETKSLLLADLLPRLIPDSHGKSSICSLYLDTPSFLIIRNSIQGKVYKEKLRLRCYGTPTLDDKVFFEIKKKFKGVVYKRRVPMTLKQAYLYIDNSIKPVESQIMSEIDYAMNFYGNPKPSALIAYEREAYYVKEHPNLRITFDSNIRYRTKELCLEKGAHGDKILTSPEFIMEIKCDGTIPLWLSEILNRYEVFPSSFSKYGTAYNEFSTNHSIKGEQEYATV